MNTELLQKYISGNATEAEKQHVTKWMQESPENMREYMAQRKLYDIALWRTAPIAEEKRQPKKIFSLRTLWIEAAKIAAIFAVILLGTHFWFEKHSIEQSESLQSIHVPAGQRAELMLADGTKVWLNSLSTLTFPGNFTGDIRNVKLDGEGYFKVAHDTRHTFIVQVGELEVKVLGTVFNVCAYQDEQDVTVVLLEGKVGVHTPSSSLIMKPGEKMNYNKSTHKFTTEKVYPEDYVTWTKGSLYFQNESLDNIMKALSRVYDVTIHIDSPRIAEERFTGTIPGGGIQNALNIIMLTSPFRYEVKDSVIVLKEK